VDKNVEFFFFLLETREPTFFAKNIIRKCQISKYKKGPRPIYSVNVAYIV